MLTENQLTLVKEMAVRGRTPALRSKALDEVIEHTKDETLDSKSDEIWDLKDLVSSLTRTPPSRRSSPSIPTPSARKTWICTDRSRHALAPTPST